MLIVSLIREESQDRMLQYLKSKKSLRVLYGQQTRGINRPSQHQWLWRLPWPRGRRIPGSHRWTPACTLWPPGCRSPWLRGTRVGLETRPQGLKEAHIQDRITAPLCTPEWVRGSLQGPMWAISALLKGYLSCFTLFQYSASSGVPEHFQYLLAGPGYGFQTEEQSGISLCRGWFPARRQTGRLMRCLNQHRHLFSSRIVGYLRQRMIKQNLLVDETQRIFDCGILQSDRRPASCCRASHEEPQHGEHKHRKCHQHWDGLQGRDHHINEEDLTTGEHETSLSNLRSNSKREARKFSPTSDPWFSDPHRLREQSPALTLYDSQKHARKAGKGAGLAVGPPIKTQIWPWHSIVQRWCSGSQEQITDHTTAIGQGRRHARTCIM